MTKQLFEEIKDQGDYAVAVPVENESPLARYYAAGGKVEIVGV